MGLLDLDEDFKVPLFLTIVDIGGHMILERFALTKEAFRFDHVSLEEDLILDCIHWNKSLFKLPNENTGGQEF